MKATILTDPCEYVGGAELTMGEFASASPVPLVDIDQAETVVLGNVVTFGPGLIRKIQGKRVYWYHNDLSKWINPELKGWLDTEATHVFCSPLQRDRYRCDTGSHLIPPAIDLKKFRASQNGKRDGMVSIGSWQNPQKGQPSLWEYSRDHGPIDIYGEGPYSPSKPPLDYKGPLDPDDVPEVLSAYSTFVHLPWAVEPFGRCVVEAWANGLQIVANRLVGCLYWIKEAPSALESAATDFWEIVLNA